MSLPVRSPGSSLARLHDEIDRMWGDFTGSGFWPWPEPKGFSPALDLYEKDNTLFVEAELPGVPKEAVSITCEDHHLSIQGETRQEKEEKHEGYYRSERRSGSFYRSVELPVDIDPSKAKAEFHEGVLKISLPKVTNPAAPKNSIPITG